MIFLCGDWNKIYIQKTLFSPTFAIKSRQNYTPFDGVMTKTTVWVTGVT